jgi:filamentous hemagglutinin
LLPESEFQSQTVSNNQSPNFTFQQQFFATYSDSSSVTLRSVGSTVTLVNQAAAPNSLLAESASSLGLAADKNGKGGNGYSALRVLPPTLSAIAFGGDVDVDGSMDLWPSAHGNLDLLASGSVLFQSPSSFKLVMSDADPAQLPSIQQPLVTLAGSAVGAAGVMDTVINNLEAETSGSGVSQPEHASSPLHGGAYSLDQQPDSTPARIVGLTGDVEFTQAFSTATPNPIFIPKPLDLLAGQDIINLDLQVQQFAPNNVSNIIAGGNITYTNSRLSTGVLQTNTGGIEIDGPGQATVSAGGTIDLGTSNGIVSVGNLNNPVLPQGGASLTVQAGVPLNPDYSGFIKTYLTNSDTYDQALIQYMEAFEATPLLSKAQALADFTALSAYDQTTLIDTVLFDEIRTGGRAAATAGATFHNYTQAFNALTSLFPNSDLNLSKAATNPYPGNIILDFSRVYTEQGGDINLLAPGGQIDVGLAVAPTSFGLTKQASQLGIVAQSTGSVNLLANGDVNVNQSRIFAADGGDILIWSTWGNIDAGRGSKTSISAPPPTITIDPTTGQVTVTFPAALQGSGIQALATSTGVSPGDVDLFAPNGVVNANDAGIVAGNLTIAATAVLGASNITFSGTAVGLPPPVIPLGAVTSAAASTGAAATEGGDMAAGENASQAKSPLATGAIGWLDVFVLGLGEEQCKADDLECLKRQKHD